MSIRNDSFIRVHSRSFVTRENICQLVRKLSESHKPQIEYISIDIDGNDGYLTEELLKDGFHPELMLIRHSIQ